MKCAFSGGWEEACSEEATVELFCELHRDYNSKHCDKCEKQAVTYCIETVMGGTLVCGEPLCDTHKYTCRRHSYEDISNHPR